MEPTLTSLEEAVLESQSKLDALISDIGTTETAFQHLSVIKQVSQNIETMQDLLARLRNQL